MDKTRQIIRRNRWALALLVAAVMMTAILLALPAFRFESTVFSKKYNNTFKGDEKYVEAMAEVEDIAEVYRQDGAEVERNEAFTERTNSKGEKTSLLAVSLTEKFNKSGWSMMAGDLNFSWVMKAIFLCLILTVLFAFCGSLGSMARPHATLPKGTALARSLAGWSTLVGLLLVPVFLMCSNYTMSRRVGLLSEGLVTEGKDQLYARLDALLFDGLSGDGIENALKGLKFSATPALLATMLCLAVALVAAIALRWGSVKHTLLRGILYAFVIGLSVFILYPYYVMAVTAFRSLSETNDMFFLHIFPVKWLWSNLMDIINRGVFRYLLNSLLIAGGATAIALLCGIPAAYAMARMKFRGKKAFLGFVIMSQMFSPIVLLIGIAQLMGTLHLNNSIVGLMLINAAFNQAFAIWLLRGTFVSISPEMEQAARIDGCNTVKALVRVLLPMAAPGIVTTLIFVFINAWNEYTISTVLITNKANRPITVGITEFSSFNMIEWQYLFAASLLATIPVVILFMAIEKHLTSGLTSGGVKG